MKFAGTADLPIGDSVGGGGDLDGDGHDDVVLGAGYGLGVFVAFGSDVASGVDHWDTAVSTGGERGTVVPDVTGDGMDDLVVGHTLFDGGGWARGAAFLIAGSPDFPSEVTLDQVDAAFLGEEDFDGAGSAVGSAGDFDGDGAADLFVSATRSEAPAAGSVYLIRGPVEPGEGSLAESFVEVRSAESGERVGDAVGSGDINGDGLTDLLIGAPPQPVSEAKGGAYVIYGDQEAPSLVLLGESALAGRETSDYTGQTVAVGDLDGDGFDDVAIGSPGFDTSRGAVDVVPGRATSIPSGDLVNAGTRLTGANVGDVAAMITVPGDIDGDEVDDLVVAAYQEDSAAGLAGAVYVVLGRAGGLPAMDITGADATQHGEYAGQMAGWTVAAAGDFDADGHADYLVSTAPSEVGAAFLVLGSAF